MSTSRTPYSTGPAGPGTSAPDWGTVGLRMFLVIVPSVLMGFAVAITLLPATTLVGHPHAGWLLDVPPGLIAGLVLGLVLRPAAGSLGGFVGLSAAVTAVAVLALVMLAQLRVPGPASGLRISSVVLGLVVTVVLQSAIAGLLWWRRGRAR